jgi:phospholipid transport system transporter-binding protein
MKTRKQQKLQQKSARQRPTQRGAAQRRPAGARSKAAPAKPAQRRIHDRGSLILASECTVAEADALKSELARRLDEPEAVTVDVTALQRIDTAGLQLLAAFVRDRRTAGRTFAWRGRAAALEAAAVLLGLDSVLELPGEAGR